MIFAPYTEERTLALAGIAQSVLLVDQLAREGSAQQNAVDACIQALFCQNPATALEVFGDPGYFKPGLQSLPGIFRMGGNPMPMRYLVQSIHLQKMFIRRGDMVEVVATSISNIAGRHASSLDEDREFMFREIGELYQRTLSTLSFRIQVHGHHQYLQNPGVAHQIRAMLLSAVRFSLLWHQLQGKRMDFLFAKRTIGEQAQRILKSL